MEWSELDEVETWLSIKAPRIFFTALFTIDCAVCRRLDDGESPSSPSTSSHAAGGCAGGGRALLLLLLLLPPQQQPPQAVVNGMRVRGALETAAFATFTS